MRETGNAHPYLFAANGQGWIGREDEVLKEAQVIHRELMKIRRGEDGLARIAYCNRRGGDGDGGRVGGPGGPGILASQAETEAVVALGAGLGALDATALAAEASAP